MAGSRKPKIPYIKTRAFKKAEDVMKADKREFSNLLHPKKEMCAGTGKPVEIVVKTGGEPIKAS